MTNDKITVRCDKCGKEFRTRLWEAGDMHGDPCGGEFIPVTTSDDLE